MSRRHEGRPLRVGEPVQVYLRAEEQDRLQRLVERLDSTKSEVLRQGLEALERQLTEPASHPALRIIAIADTRSEDAAIDAARDHDAVLAESEVDSWDRAE